jgi:hypothetical protein
LAGFSLPLDVLEYMDEDSCARVSFTLSGAVHWGLPADFGVSAGVNTSDNTSHYRVNTPRFHVDFLDFRRLVGEFPRETLHPSPELHKNPCKHGVLTR